MAPARTLLALLLLIAPLAAHGTVMLPVEFDDKVEQASTIVLGKVVNQTARWDESRNWILTYTTFRIEKTMKGVPAQEITIVTPGGQVGEIAQDAVGVPRFQEGREHVLFVRPTSAGPTVLYLEQGAYEVDGTGSSRIVRPMVESGAAYASTRGAASAAVPADSPRELRDFEAAVRGSMQRREALRMQLLEQQRQAETSIVQHLLRNKGLVVLALLGLGLAIWQLRQRW